jgi:DNA-binding LytR/AlgR family response regulator
LNIHCIIIEDEPVSQDILKRYIADTPPLKLVGVCNNAFEAQELLLDEQVHLMFLDINMPKLSGMSFLKSLKNPPLVIFTTAYPEYALEGYEVDAVDYLLKPFSFDRFIKAVNKAVERLRSSEKPAGQEGFVMLRADKKIFKVAISSISHLEAMGDYVKVFYDSKYIMVHDTLQHLLEEIGSTDLVRIHRSWAVSIKHINYVEGNLVMIGDREIPVGKSYKENFLERINP